MAAVHHRTANQQQPLCEKRPADTENKPSPMRSKKIKTEHNECETTLGGGVETCRVCLRGNPAYRCVFDYFHDEKMSIDEMIESLCSVHMNKDDPLPNNICWDCFEDLKLAFTFRRRCRASDQVLRGQLMEKRNVKEEPVENFNIPNAELILTPEVQLKESPSEIIIRRDDSNAEPTPSNELKTYMKQYRETSDAIIIKEGNFYVCRMCGYTTHDHDNMSCHVGIHLIPERSPKPSKRPEQPQQQQQHHQQSTGDRFPCDKCDYVGTTKRYLQKHMVRHTTDRKYTCDVCKYTCKRSGELNRHSRTHDSEGKYACTECGFTTKWQSSMTMHVRAHRGDEEGAAAAFKCDECDFTSRWKSSVAIHKSRKHKVEGGVGGGGGGGRVHENDDGAEDSEPR